MDVRLVTEPSKRVRQFRLSGVGAHARESLTAASSVTESLTLTSKPNSRLTHPHEHCNDNKNYRLSAARSKNFDSSRHLEIFKHDENKDGDRIASRLAEFSSSASDDATYPINEIAFDKRYIRILQIIEINYFY